MRWSIARTMRLGAMQELDATGRVPRLYAELLAGGPVVLTASQVRSFVPPSRHPANLDRWPRWLLRGDDQLTVWRRKS